MDQEAAKISKNERKGMQEGGEICNVVWFRDFEERQEAELEVEVRILRFS